MSQFPPSNQPPSQPGHGQGQQGYTQPQWQGQPMYQPPPKKSRKGLWIVLGVLAALLIFGCIGTYAILNAGANATQHALTTASTQIANAGTPTQPSQSRTSGGGKWTAVQTFSGSGTKKTAIFSVPGDWKIVWSCQGFTDGSGVDGTLAVTINGTDNVPIDVLSETCKAGGHSSGESEEHQGGQVYLSIDATGGWKVQVQVLK